MFSVILFVLFIIFLKFGSDMYKSGDKPVGIIAFILAFILLIVFFKI